MAYDGMGSWAFPNHSDLLYGTLVTLFYTSSMSQGSDSDFAVSNDLADSRTSEIAHVASLEPECVPALFESKLPCAWIGWRVIADRHALGLSAAINGN